MLAIVVVILYFMFREKYRLKDPFYYIDFLTLVLNIKSLILIYINVGFFMVQIFFDSKREGCGNFWCCERCKGEIKLIKKYYFYSIRLIINKAEKYLIKIKESSKVLNDALKISQNEANSEFHKFLTDKVQLIKKDFELYKFDKYEEPNNDANPLKKEDINIHVENSSEVRNVPIIKDEKAAKRIQNIKSESELKLQKEIKDKEKNFETLLSQHIRNYNKATRRIKKLKKIYNDISEEYNYDYQLKTKSFNISDYLSYMFCFCCNRDARYGCFKNFKYCILASAFAMVIITDIILPLSLYNESNKIVNITNITSLINDTYYLTENVLTDSLVNDTTSSNDSNNLFLNILDIIFYAILLIAILFITVSFTIIMLFSTNRRNYISKDFLSGKKINDDISLMKTLKEICSYSFPLVYCNFYFLKTASKKPLIFYEQNFFPDYELKHGISLYMIAKLVVTLFSIILFKYFGGISILLNNDLAEFNKNINDNNYNVTEDESQFNSFINNNKVLQILKGLN